MFHRAAALAKSAEHLFRRLRRRMRNGALAKALLSPPRESADAKTIRESGLFDYGWYRAQYPGTAGADPIAHYLRRGAAKGSDPNAYFDTSWYLEIYPDVRAAGLNPLVHYISFGADEGRDPSAAFSTQRYRERYLSEGDAAVNPLAHYLRFGKSAGNRLESAHENYLMEVLLQDQALANEMPELLRHIDVMVIRPQFLVVIAGGSEGARSDSERSLQNQIYADWILAASIDALPDVPADGEKRPWFVVWLEAGDRLHAAALYAFASAINADPTLDLVYADEDQFNQTKARFSPFYKPDWSPDYLESVDYISQSACFRAAIAGPLLTQAQGAYDLVLRFTEASQRIAHVRRVLFHRRRSVAEPADEREIEQDIAALAGRLRRTNRSGEVRPVLPRRRCYDAKLSLAARPLVSIVIPTAGKTVDLNGRSIDLIVNCLETVVARTTYKNIEVVVVDNGDLNAKQRAVLKRFGAKSITYRERVFNVAKKLNLGASAATGEMLLLLNDDIEPLSADWIERLLEHFEKPHVGVVGAKLLYESERTQHVGVVLNSGNPDHVRRLEPRDDLGYFFSTAAARNFIAVTGACMMARASVYRDVGGYTEALAVNFNDIDFCLKIGERGLTSVYAPRAELFHFESQSRRVSLDIEELHYFHRRWARVSTDPYYNESELSVASPTFEPRHNPRAF
jgi:GT2 family glycosyltransferase